MYKHLLIPLDESEVAEAALVHAEGLAKCLDARLTLFAVLPLGAETRTGAEASSLQARREELKEYLRSRCARLVDEGVQCHASVREGDIGEEIARYAEKHEVDLIVMSTHGRTGLARWVYGSVADRVLTQTSVPVLIVRAEGS